jgi:pilus assembly protein CpaE
MRLAHLSFSAERGNRMQPIKVMVVDDVAETRASIRQLLELNGGFEVIGEAADGQEALAKAVELRPDCVLLDINMPVMDGITAAERFFVQFPEIAVVMMSVQGEKEYLRKSMAAGARDYLVKPFSPDELADTITRAVQVTQRRYVEGMPVITKHVLVLGPKGGVGRTTIAANVALALAALGDSTCLLDLNTQFSDLAMMVYFVPVQTLSALQGNETITSDDIESVVEKHDSGAHVLFAPTRPEEAESVDVPLIEGVLGALQSLYEWVVVDAPAGLHDLVFPVLDRRPTSLLVMTPELAPVRNTGQLLKLLHELEYDMDAAKVVLNCWDAKKAVTAEVIERNLKLPVSIHIPYDPEVMQAAANRGVPVVAGNPRSNSAKALQELVDHLCGKIDEKPKRRVFAMLRRETKWAMS